MAFQAVCATYFEFVQPLEGLEFSPEMFETFFFSSLSATRK